MAKTGVDLTSIFQTVTQALADNQESLNQADDRNQDHGTNMVQTFQTITGALEKKQGSSASTALSYAAKQLSKSTTSSSGQLYAQNLTQAAAQFKGQKVDAQGALQLLQTLIGSSQAGQPASGQPAGGADMLAALLGGQGAAQPSAAGGADMLGALLGSLGGEQASAAGAPQAAGGADMLGALLGSLGGEQASAAGAPQAAGGADKLGALLGGPQAPAAGTSAPGEAQGGLDMSNLLGAGMAFLQAKQSGGSNMQALMQAFMTGSGMGNTAHRTQSTQLVVNSFLQALGGAAAKQR